MSMVGKNMMGLMSQWLQQARHHHAAAQETKLRKMNVVILVKLSLLGEEPNVADW